MKKIRYVKSWEEWKELCSKYNIDPYAPSKFVIDEGKDSFNIEYIGDTPAERED